MSDPSSDGVLQSRLRSSLRSAVELVATGSGLSSLVRGLSAGRATVVAYHNVVPPGDASRGDASLHLPLPDFVEQIDWLARTHDVVGLDTAASALRGRRPQAVITFDDAYRGAVSLALPELVRRGLPATVFVPPAMLGAASTWWDELGEARLLTTQTRRLCLDELSGVAEAVRGRYPEAAGQDLPESYGIATIDELLGACRDGIMIASHSWAHEHLPSLGPSDLETSLARALRWLDDLDTPTTSWLALPYGAGTSGTVAAAMALGHAGVLRISGGRWGRERGRAGVPRINVPAGLSVRGLDLRASGLKA